MQKKLTKELFRITKRFFKEIAEGRPEGIDEEISKAMRDHKPNNLRELLKDSKNKIQRNSQRHCQNNYQRHN